MSLADMQEIQPSDEALLDAAIGEPEAFGLFYDRHFDALLAYFYKRTSDPHVAADLTAETFAEALKSLKRFDSREGVAAGWLFGIARNHLRHHFRSRGIHYRAVARLTALDLTLDDASLEHIENSIDVAAQLPLLMSGLDRLSPLLRRAVVLRVADNMTFDELSIALGCSPGTARQRVSRGLIQLHDFLTADD